MGKCFVLYLLLPEEKKIKKNLCEVYPHTRHSVERCWPSKRERPGGEDNVWQQTYIYIPEKREKQGVGGPLEAQRCFGWRVPKGHVLRARFVNFASRQKLGTRGHPSTWPATSYRISPHLSQSRADASRNIWADKGARKGLADPRWPPPPAFDADCKRDSSPLHRFVMCCQVVLKIQPNKSTALYSPRQSGTYGMHNTCLRLI